MTQFAYLGESDGGRIIRLGGAALAQITTAGSEAVLPRWETWDVLPMGAAGDVVFRMVVVTLEVSNGYAIRVTPIVDGTALQAQEFSGGGAGRKVCQAAVSARGASCAVLVEVLSRTGDLEVVNVEVAYFPLRAIP